MATKFEFKGTPYLGRRTKRGIKVGPDWQALCLCLLPYPVTAKQMLAALKYYKRKLDNAEKARRPSKACRKR